MSNNGFLDQNAVDAALVSIARYADGDINLGELKQDVSYEAAAAVAKTRLVNISVTKKIAGNWTIRFTMAPKVMPEGRARIDALTGK